MLIGPRHKRALFVTTVLWALHSEAIWHGVEETLLVYNCRVINLLFKTVLKGVWRDVGRSVG